MWSGSGVPANSLKAGTLFRIHEMALESPHAGIA